MKEYERAVVNIIWLEERDLLCGASMEDQQSGGDVIIDNEDLFSL